MAFELSSKRELNKGFGDALQVAVELAVTPAIFAFLGWKLDSWLGTSPLARTTSSTDSHGYGSTTPLAVSRNPLVLMSGSVR